MMKTISFNGVQTVGDLSLPDAEKAEVSPNTSGKVNVADFRAADAIIAQNGSRKFRHRVLLDKAPPGITLPSVHRDNTSHTIFSKDRKSGDIFIQNENGHSYLVPRYDTPKDELEPMPSMRFEKDGLNNLRKKYEQAHGSASFLYSMFGFDHQYKQLKDMTEYPEYYPYFSNERFFIVPNAPGYTSEDCDDLKNSSAQKMKDSGVVLCGWIMPEELSCLQDEKPRQLLRELDHDHPCEDKPVLKELKDQYDARNNDDVGYTWDDSKRDVRTIKEMRASGKEYLATILDLNKSHLGMLKNLKEKSLQHLKDKYNLDEKKDHVEFYFHFPYSKDTTALHLHVRLNHGLHPFDKSYSVFLDEIISGLEENKTVDDILMNHQKENGRFYCMQSHLPFFQGIEGVEINENDVNVFRTKEDETFRVHSQDDLDVDMPRRVLAEDDADMPEINKGDFMRVYPKDDLDM